MLKDINISNPIIPFFSWRIVLHIITQSPEAKVNSLRVIIIYCCLITIFFDGCKKTDIQGPDPEVEISLPYNNQTFNVFDTVFIIAKIKHVQEINKISLTINGKDLKPVVSGKTLDINQTSYHLSTFLIIDNKYIEGNLNYLLIKIEDNNAVYNFWQPISINPLNKELEKILIVTGMLNENTLFKANISGDIEKIASWTSEYIGGYGDSKNRMFYTSGELVDGIRGYDLDEIDLLWMIPPETYSSIPYFNAFSGSEGRVTVSTSEGIIESYNHLGLKILSSNKVINGIFTNILDHDNFVIGIFKPYVGNQNSLIIFNNPAGSIYASLQFQGNVIDLLKIDKNSIMLIINETGNVKSYLYNYALNQLQPLHEITTNEVFNISGDAENIFFATNNGILWYRPSIGSIVEYLQMDDIRTLAFDNNSNLLYFSRGSSLLVSGLPFKSVLDSTEFTSPIKDIELIYNK